jgi:hypothetical protein
MFHSAPVIVQDLAHIRHHLQAGNRAVLRSAPGAGLFAGAGFWRALIAAAQAEFPGQIEADILDCADSPGQAMAALRAGCRHVVLDPASPAWPAVASAAEACGAILLT